MFPSRLPPFIGHMEQRPRRTTDLAQWLSYPEDQLKKKETTSRMSEVNGRATPAHRRQRSRHTHAHATRRAPSAPPQRPRPHPRTRTHALAPTLRNLMLRAAAALHANTAHNPHPTTLTGQHRMLRARMTLTTATATATHTVRDPPRRDRHSQPPSIHATIHAHLIPTDALLGGCFGIYPAQPNTVKQSKAFIRTLNSGICVFVSTM